MPCKGHEPDVLLSALIPSHLRQQNLTAGGVIAPSPLESLTSLFSSSSRAESRAESSKSGGSWKKYIPEDPIVVGVLSAVIAAGASLSGARVYRRYCKRIRNANYVTTGMLDSRRVVRGVVTSVGDGDNFRLFHTPLFYRWPIKFRSVPTNPKELKDETLHIRIAGVDAPECAHFGNPAQPHSAESLEWLRKRITGKSMKCEMLRKDQYGRIVAVPYIYRWYWTDQPLPLMMLEKGMAVVYTAGGAEYGNWGLEKMKALEAEAKRAKRGLWGLKTFEHPADYKKRMKMAEEGLPGPTTVARQREGRGWWKAVTRWLAGE